MALTRIVLSDSLTAAQVADKARLAPLGRPATIGLADYINSIAAGVNSASLTLQVGATQATATLTVTGAPTAAQTVVIAGVTITARASGATTNEFNIGGNVTATASAIAAAINASPTLSPIVTATSAVGVVTLTSVVPGLVGNGLILTNSLSNVTPAAFSGAVNGTQYVIDRA